MRESSVDPYAQTLPSVLIDNVEDAKWTAIMSAVMHEIIAPYMFGEFRSQTYDRTVVEPQMYSFRLFWGYFHALEAPDPLNPLEIDDPTLFI